jgi:antitoxin component of MazEF toxin-antitoxin module
MTKTYCCFEGINFTDQLTHCDYGSTACSSASSAISLILNLHGTYNVLTKGDCLILRKRITTVGNSAAIVLSRDLLKLMNLDIGDEVEISVVDRVLVLRSVADAARVEKVSAAVDDVFKRRKKLLTRLAAGVEDVTSDEVGNDLSQQG